MNRVISFLNRYKATLLISTLSFTAVCCSTKYLIPTQADVAVAQKQWPGTTLENLNSGYDIYADKCTDCHGKKKPQKYSLEEWSNIMPKMGRKSKLDSARYNLVYHYILTKRESIINHIK